MWPRLPSRQPTRSSTLTAPGAPLSRSQFASDGVSSCTAWGAPASARPSPVLATERVVEFGDGRFGSVGREVRFDGCGVPAFPVLAGFPDLGDGDAVRGNLRGV